MLLVQVISICCSLLLFTSAEVFNPSLSNGTCWYSKNEQADDTYIPCGNAALGDQTCCQARDVCLSSSACFNLGYMTTYIAGCTDSTYTNSSVCPPKGRHNDQQWVGLVRCYVSNETSEQLEEWAGCLEESGATVSTGQSCSCNTSAHTAAFTDSPDLTNIASLPVTIGNIIAWFPGYTPAIPTESSTTDSTASSSSGQTLTSSITLLPPASIGSVSSSAGDQSSSTTSIDSSIPTVTSTTLSTASKAAIGVGTATGVLGIGALMAWIAMRYRKKKTLLQSLPPKTEQTIPDMTNRIQKTHANNEETSGEAMKSPAWSGHKSELPGGSKEDVFSSGSGHPPQQSLSSTIDQGSSRHHHLSVSTSTPVNYRAYSPHMSQVSEVEGSSTLDLNKNQTSLSPARLARDEVYEMPG